MFKKLVAFFESLHFQKTEIVMIDGEIRLEFRIPDWLITITHKETQGTVIIYNPSWSHPKFELVYNESGMVSYDFEEMEFSTFLLVKLLWSEIPEIKNSWDLADHPLYYF